MQCTRAVRLWARRRSSNVSRGCKFAARWLFCGRSCCAGSFLRFVVFLLQGSCSPPPSSAAGDRRGLQQCRRVAAVFLRFLAHVGHLQKTCELMKQLLLEIPSTLNGKDFHFHLFNVYSRTIYENCLQSPYFINRNHSEMCIIALYVGYIIQTTEHIKLLLQWSCTRAESGVLHANQRARCSNGFVFPLVSFPAWWPGLEANRLISPTRHNMLNKEESSGGFLNCHIVLVVCLKKNVLSSLFNFRRWTRASP